LLPTIDTPVFPRGRSIAHECVRVSRHLYCQELRPFRYSLYCHLPKAAVLRRHLPDVGWIDWCRTGWQHRNGECRKDEV
jgi:hypothetical protein